MRQEDFPGAAPGHAPDQALRELPGPSGEDASLRTNRLAFLATGATILIADLITKAAIAGNLQPHEVRRVIGHWVRLTYIHNPGAAFGLFPGSRAVLIAISISAVVVVALVAWRSRGDVKSVIPLGLILGGALGNLVDRVRLGEVVDFVQIGVPPNMYWPVFNVADSAVTIGVTWLAFGLVRGKREDEGTLVVEESVAKVAPSGDEA